MRIVLVLCAGGRSHLAAPLAAPREIDDGYDLSRRYVRILNIPFRRTCEVLPMGGVCCGEPSIPECPVPPSTLFQYGIHRNTAIVGTWCCPRGSIRLRCSIDYYGVRHTGYAAIGRRHRLSTSQVQYVPNSS